jgi:hypothetical protein
MRRLTKEHVLGKWIKDVFPEGPSGGAYSRLGWVGDNERSEIRYDTELFEQEVRAVCSECNNGWMSTMEASVQGFLSPMVHHWEQTRLTRHDQRHLAAWTLKTLLVSQYMQPAKRFIPDSVYADFYKTKEPGNNHMIWLGARAAFDNDDTGAQVVSAMQVSPLNEFVVPANMPEKRKLEFSAGVFYVGTLALGAVILQVFGHNLALGFDLIRKPPGWLFRIWKPQSHIVWPPAVGVGSFEGLHESLKPPRQEPP